MELIGQKPIRKKHIYDAKDEVARNSRLRPYRKSGAKMGKMTLEYALRHFEDMVVQFDCKLCDEGIKIIRAAIGAQPATVAAGEPSAVQQLQAAIALVKKEAGIRFDEIELEYLSGQLNELAQRAAV
jgi:hypothetical protein